MTEQSEILFLTQNYNDFLIILIFNSWLYRSDLNYEVSLLSSLSAVAKNVSHFGMKNALNRINAEITSER